jgi:hypothetical protein
MKAMLSSVALDWVIEHEPEIPVVLMHTALLGLLGAAAT